MEGGTTIVNRYAIQTWYKLQFDHESLKLSCDEIIKIPLNLSIIAGSTRMTPCVVITTGDPWIDDATKIEIETNEGFTIEPVKVGSESHVSWVYILTLPPKTTGLKNVKVFAVDRGHQLILQTDLVFDIMYPPYNYEGAALENVAKTVYSNEDTIIDLSTQLEDLTTRVEALEQKP